MGVLDTFPGVLDTPHSLSMDLEGRREVGRRERDHPPEDLGFRVEGSGFMVEGGVY